MVSISSALASWEHYLEGMFLNKLEKSKILYKTERDEMMVAYLGQTCIQILSLTLLPYVLHFCPSSVFPTGKTEG